MKILITGSDGFIGRNLQLHLSERRNTDVVCFNRGCDPSDFVALLQDVDFIFHLAGVNRPQDEKDFGPGNLDIANHLSNAVSIVAEVIGKKIPIVYTSSIQAANDTPYGRSKYEVEKIFELVAKKHGIPLHILRLPNVFGKWAQPNYNSAVATFCHNISRNMPIKINDADAAIALVYIDDLIRYFIYLLDCIDSEANGDSFLSVVPQYEITVGELANTIQAFKNSRDTLTIERVGVGLTRALYATYISYLPTRSFVYSIPRHADARGVFVEMLKTPDAGQFSFFTAHSGVTRGGHYHHSKTEKFLVIKGEARFRFRHLMTGERYEVFTNGDHSEIVETVPGWTHDITNIGNDDMVVMLWANELFDHARPDTFPCPF